MTARSGGIACDSDNSRAKDVRAAIGHELAVDRAIDQCGDLRVSSGRGKTGDDIFAVLGPQFGKGTGIATICKWPISRNKLTHSFAIFKSGEAGG